jgi:hypothetical protein
MKYPQPLLQFDAYFIQLRWARPHRFLGFTVSYFTIKDAIKDHILMLQHLNKIEMLLEKFQYMSFKGIFIYRITTNT